MLERVVVVLRELMTRTPPNVSDRFVLADWLAWLSVGKQLKHLDMRGRRDLLDLFTKSAGEMLDQWFESEPLKAVLGWRAEEHTSELQSLMRTSYAVFCVKRKQKHKQDST